VRRPENAAIPAGRIEEVPFSPEARPPGHLGDLVAHRAERLGRRRQRREDGRAQAHHLQAEVADGLAEGLELLLGASQPAHKLPRVGEQLDERASGSDAPGASHWC